MTIFLVSTLIIGCKSEKESPQILTAPSTIQKDHQNATGFALGKQLFEGKGKCNSCHLTNRTSVGPSIQSIVTVYKEENGDIVAFLKQEAEPIVAPEKYAVMKTNFALLKTFTNNELLALETYMLQIDKE